MDYMALCSMLVMVYASTPDARGATVQLTMDEESRNGVGGSEHRYSVRCGFRETTKDEG